VSERSVCWSPQCITHVFSFLACRNAGFVIAVGECSLTCLTLARPQSDLSPTNYHCALVSAKEHRSALDHGGGSKPQLEKKTD
jgi:hypothetical protein